MRLVVSSFWVYLNLLFTANFRVSIFYIEFKNVSLTKGNLLCIVSLW